MGPRPRQAEGEGAVTGIPSCAGLPVSGLRPHAEPLFRFSGQAPAPCPAGMSGSPWGGSRAALPSPTCFTQVSCPHVCGRGAPARAAQVQRAVLCPRLDSPDRP